MSVKSFLIGTAKFVGRTAKETAKIGAATAVGGTATAYGCYSNPMQLDETKNQIASGMVGTGLGVVTYVSLDKIDKGIGSMLTKRRIKKEAEKIEAEASQLVEDIFDDEL